MNRYLSGYAVSPVLLTCLAALFLMAGGLYVFQKNENQTDSSRQHPDPTSNGASSSKPTLTSGPNVFTGKVVVSSAGSNIVQYIFNPVSKQVEKTTSNIAASDYANAGYGIGDNETVQVASNGATYYFESVGVEGGIGDTQTPAGSYTEIRKAPNKAIFHQDGAQVVAKAWKITKDGNQLYLALPTAGGVGNDLYTINTDSLKKRKIASLGVVSTPLILSGDETQLLVGEERKRTEGGYEYHDYYDRQVDLASGSVTEKLLWKDRKDGHNPFFDLGSLNFGPKLVKAVASDRSNENYTLHSINLADGKETDLYQFKGAEGDNISAWSGDGLKVLFATNNPFGTDVAAPSDQGILLYDFATDKTVQVIKTEISTKGGKATGDAIRIVRDSFDGSSFVYTQGNSVYYYDIPSSKRYMIASGIMQLDGLVAARL